MTLAATRLAGDSWKQIGTAPKNHGLSDAFQNLAYTAFQPLRYRMLYRKIEHDLSPLDDDILRDIGLSRWDIGTYARSHAELCWPARRPLRVALGEVTAGVWRALKRRREHRKTIRDLMVLDDRTLKDIGLSRSEIPWIADETVSAFD